MPRLRGVIYARVSKPGEKSVADQEKVGRRDLAELNVDVVRVFRDKQSASRYRRVQDREGFTQMKAFVQSSGIDLLWTFANNRAHRDLDDYVPLRRLCIETGTRWRYGGRTYDLANSSDRRSTNADALRSEEYSDDLSEAVRRGTEEALLEGRAHGKVPRGYRIIRDENSGEPIRREPIPEQAELLRNAAHRVLAFESLRSVSRDLAEEWKRIGARGLIEQKTLRALLINPTYAGLRTHGGKVVREGTWDPIFTVEEHKQLRALLLSPSRRTQRGTAPTYLLSYIAICSVCETHVSPKNPPPERPLSPATYRCPNGHVSRPIAAVNEHVETVLIELLEDPPTRAELNAPLDETGSVSLDGELAAIAVLEEEKLEFARDAARQKMSASVVGAYLEVKDAEIKAHQARIDALTGDPLLDDAFGPDAGDRWKGRTIENQRAIIRRLLRVEIRPIGRGNKDLGVEVYPADTPSENAEM